MDKTKFNDKKEWRKFGIGLGIILALIATVQLLKGHAPYPYFYAAGVLVALAAAAAPILVRPLFVLFSYLGVALGWFSTRVILIVLFYLLLTPIALLMRLFGKKFMAMGKESSLATYWVQRNKEYTDKGSFENQF